MNMLKKLPKKFDSGNKDRLGQWLHPNTAAGWKIIASEIEDGDEVIEIGVFHARSGIYFIEQCYENEKYNVHYHGIDIFNHDRLNNHPDVKHTITIEYAILNTIETATYRNITLRRQNSFTCHVDYPDNHFFAVSIDGAHDYKSVMKDLSNWSSKAQKYILCDDYEPHYGVYNAINDFSEQNSEIWQLHVLAEEDGQRTALFERKPKNDSQVDIEYKGEKKSVKKRIKKEDIDSNLSADTIKSVTEKI